ncbi:MAG: IS200/IS605 family transposase [Rectinemataceae bacterium]|nr:IS200/IS605 family transposase [Rectinemataceae bacterium]
MAKWKKLAHVVYQCSYHIVWTPKYRYRILEGDVAKAMEDKLRTICEWKDIEVLELNVMKDHVHMVATIPPKGSISEVMGILKGKTAIALFKGIPGLKKKPYWGNHFWSRGYCVTTIGMDEEKIRRYVKYQEDNERLEEDSAKDYGLF